MVSINQLVNFLNVFPDLVQFGQLDAILFLFYRPPFVIYAHVYLLGRRTSDSMLIFQYKIIDRLTIILYMYIYSYTNNEFKLLFYMDIQLHHLIIIQLKEES